MDVLIGIDVAEEVHWACAMDRDARVLFRQAVDDDPAEIGALIDRIEGLGADRKRTAVDMLGGMASLVCAMFAEAGLPLVHTPGLAANRARHGFRGGERKSDPKDAAVIAELARTRPGLRALGPPDPLDAEIRLLVARRRELVTEQTRRAGRLRDLLSGLFPALERRIGPTTRTGLVFLSHYAAPEDIRAAGAKRIIRRLTKAASGLRGLEAVAEAAARAVRAQTVAIPGARLRAEIIADIAREALAARDRLKLVDQAIQERLASHPDAALILSMPGMGATLTTEFIALIGRIGRFDSADALAADAGLAPMLASPADQLPAPRRRRRQGAQARLLPGRLHLPRSPRQPHFPRLQARRGQPPPPGRHRAGTTTRERPLGHPPKQDALPRKFQTRSLTDALGCDLVDGYGPIDLEPGIVVRMHPAAEAGKVILGMLTLAVAREPIPCSGRGGAARWPFVAGIGPEPRRLGLADARRQHADWYVVGKDRLGRQDMAADGICDGLKQGGGLAHPAGQGRAIQIEPLTVEDPALAVERQVISAFADQDIGEKARLRAATLDRERRQRGLDELFAAGAGQARPDDPVHDEAAWHILQLFRDILADPAQAPAAIGTGIGGGRQLHLHPGDTVRDRAALGFVLLLDVRQLHRRRHRGGGDLVRHRA
jgi:transposase